ncbi:RNA processing factor 1, putative [Ichthyophthirius multifiliis]|uniref:RNA processing factor 1, putative n=1 Tax=Ichthyophthirius multifiliis TaxID=5932 RepID=G0R1T2_ICHMU|nr:RNA processing factor 1, putative [Ichthyophthirius multifiliis]EGR28584.1 RNA processing factor 1, putative [Ichthyophthirius multifiliis]|eukprot:XP_004029820.1 RNA processing factor 1, putative [Ichthyophthirius multifiliis]
MGKKGQPSYQKLKVIPIVHGKRPGFEEDSKATKKKKDIHKGKKSYLNINPSSIACKEKRLQVLAKKQREQKKLKKKDRQARQEEYKQTGKEKLQYLTTDDKKEIDENFIFDDDDLELQNEENIDEFSSYFENGYQPKILMTTSQRPHGELFDFLKDIKNTFPNSHYYPRKALKIKQICEEAPSKGYTDVMIWREHKRQVNELILIHLPKGPTAIFKVTSDKLNYEIQNHGRPTDHYPELILNNFNTNLGRRIGRFLAALFPQKPEFKARTVATFHNQRDFIFFRHHRYQFTEEGEKVELQEIGPRFTMKLKKLQLGTFDYEFGEVEFEAKDKMYQSRKKIFI